MGNAQIQKKSGVFKTTKSGNFETVHYFPIRRFLTVSKSSRTKYVSFRGLEVVKMFRCVMRLLIKSDRLSVTVQIYAQIVVLVMSKNQF